jgi:hypothetical protein
VGVGGLSVEPACGTQKQCFRAIPTAIWCRRVASELSPGYEDGRLSSGRSQARLSVIYRSRVSTMMDRGWLFRCVVWIRRPGSLDKSDSQLDPEVGRVGLLRSCAPARRPGNVSPSSNIGVHRRADPGHSFIESLARVCAPGLPPLPLRGSGSPICVEKRGDTRQ